MTREQTPCADCGAPIMLARVAGKPSARVPLEPFPDRAGDVPVVVLRHYLMVVGRDEGGSTKRYERHRCVPAGRIVRAPEHRAQQLDLFGTGETP